MSSEDKVRRCKNGSVIPGWQQRVLDQRQQIITQGKAVFIDWEVVKNYLLARIQLNPPPSSSRH